MKKTKKQIYIVLIAPVLIARRFWRDFMYWYNSLHSEKNTRTFRKEIVYGVLNDWSSSSILNHLIRIVIGSTLYTVMRSRRIENSIRRVY